MGINVLRFPKFRLRAITRAVSIWGDGMDIKIREVGLNAGTHSMGVISRFRLAVFSLLFLFFIYDGGQCPFIYR